MNIIFHTISVEPARWTPQRVSQKLSDLIPKIAALGFKRIEIYEPHLAASNPAEIGKLLAAHSLEPVTLSSYLQLGPQASTDEQFFAAEKEVVALAKSLPFKKVRLFPGSGVSPADQAAVEIVQARISRLADDLPEVDIVLETHDGTVADDPQAIVDLVERIGRRNVGLLWQPSTLEDASKALPQLALQKHLVRHVHLFNRTPGGKFDTLKNGIIPWDKILPQLPVDMALEFAPVGVCSVEEFDLEATLQQCVSEAHYAEQISS
jgi:sugar phosphate isomerase/epimerase